LKYRLLLAFTFIISILPAEPISLTSTGKLQFNNTDVLKRSTTPHIVRTQDRSLHIAYTQRSGSSGKIYYARSSDNGATWGERKFLTAGYPYSQNGQIIKDDSDKLYIFFENSGSILYVYSNNDGKNWSTPFKVSGKFSDGKNAAVTIVENGDLHLVWQNEGNIYYRNYQQRQATWSSIFSASTGGKYSESPSITCFRSQYVYIAWIEQGEVVARKLDLIHNSWGVIEKVSVISNSTLRQTPGASDVPIILADSNENVHMLWTNNKQILHRVQVKNIWSPIMSSIDSRYSKWLGEPSAVFDMKGNTYVSFVVDNKVLVKKFNLQSMRWEQEKVVHPDGAAILLSPHMVGNREVSEFTLYTSGYDLAWIRKEVRDTDGAVLDFKSQATFAEKTDAPRITGVAQINGFPRIAWSTDLDQVGFQLVISNRNTYAKPVLYDSGKVNSPAPNFSVDKFPYTTGDLFYFVRVVNIEGNWTNWSAPYFKKAEEDEVGPFLKITELIEDSLYLHSPDPYILYYGKGIDHPKEFIIKGKVRDKGSGIKKLVFSELLGDKPPSIYTFPSEDWAVRYSIKSTDMPGKIIITAYDNSGLSTTKIVSVEKDFVSPEPPTWVAISPDNRHKDKYADKTKQDNDRTVYVTWKDGTDKGSGLRYHLMGNNPKWWKNSIHLAGDAEETVEGNNTFYVFAIDNVGNVSEAGTDKIYVDSNPPDKPEIASRVSSSNYFYGRKTPDAFEIYVNGLKEDVEILSDRTWRYKHGLRDGQIDLFHIQAIDKLGNESEALELRLGADKTAPGLFYIKHNFEKDILRVKDRLIVSMKGHPKNTAYFKIKGLTGKLPMYDDGTRGDIKADDGLYTGAYVVDTELKMGPLDLDVFIEDQAGNVSHKKADKALIFDSGQTILIDDFEAYGDHYPWKNHALGENINSAQEEYARFKLKDGKGALRIDYDFAGSQSWAGVASEESIEQNLYGSRCYINFWLKGSGSSSVRLFVYLQGNGKRNISTLLNDIQTKNSVSMINKEWHKVSIPVASEFLDELDTVKKYYLYVYSTNDNEKAQGTLYVDKLTISYRVEDTTVYHGIFDKKQQRTPQTDSTVMDEAIRRYTTTEKGKFKEAPFIQPMLYPGLFIKGESAVIKVQMPQNIRASLVYVHWGTSNSALRSTRLLKAAGKIWKGELRIPKSYLEGDHFGIIYIKTQDNHYYKKKFVYKVYDRENINEYNRISTIFFPHPLIPDSGASIKVKIPQSLRAKSVVLFFGEDSSDVYSAEVKKTGKDESLEIWQGSAALPGNMLPGDYTAIVYIKTKDNRFIKQKAIYSVLQK